VECQYGNKSPEDGIQPTPKMLYILNIPQKMKNVGRNNEAKLIFYVYIQVLQYMSLYTCMFS
jgi:hypothetical protein